MSNSITTLFWDIGGVVLTNGWDHDSRMIAAQTFGLDWEEFRERHDLSFPAFDAGQISLNQYLDRTIFYRPRPFTREEFSDFMFSLSQPLPEMLPFAQALANSGKYFMGTINNESRELNNYRIDKFGLRKVFRIFISSCFVGLRKPERDIYRTAVEITQIAAEQCCFIDDRALNLECAAQLGMKTIQMESPDQLRRELEKLRVIP